MRPSRYFPKTTSTQTIIDNLAYCMGTMVEAEKECTEGIAFVANMDRYVEHLRIVSVIAALFACTTCFASLACLFVALTLLPRK